MEITFYDDKFNVVHVFDTYRSCIWTELYRGMGEFTLTLDAIPGIIGINNATQWVGCDLTDNLMDIRTMSLRTDPEEGNTAVFKGTSLEGILKQRIDYDGVSGYNSAQDIVELLLRRNFTYPSDSMRQYKMLDLPIPQRIVTRPTGAPNSMQNFSSFKAVDADGIPVKQYSNVYDAVQDQATSADCGWKIRYDGSRFNFDMYDGTDLSTGANGGYVEFSSTYDNIANTEYSLSDMDQFTYGVLREPYKDTVVGAAVTSGAEDYLLWEAYLDASQIPAKDVDGTDLTADEYAQVLTQYGLSEYARRRWTSSFTCEVEPFQSFRFGLDYNLGDLVKVQDDFGFSSVCRVSEVTYSADRDGFKIVPTFKP